MIGNVLTKEEHFKVTLLDIRGLDPVERYLRPVSFIKQQDGTYLVLSRYGDDEWELPATRFPNSTKRSKRIFRFNSLPVQFRDAMKGIIERFDEGHNRSGGSVVKFFANAKLYLDFLDSKNVNCLSAITPMICNMYVNHCHGRKNHQGKSFSAGGLYQLFQAVELIQLHTKGTVHEHSHPWIESSACALSGLYSRGGQASKTEVIPDGVLQPLFQAAKSLLDRADELIEIHNRLLAIEDEADRYSASHGCSQSDQRKYLKGKYLNTIGNSDARVLSHDLRDLQTACAIIIMTLSGVRVHELSWLMKTRDDHGPWRPVKDLDEHTMYWMASRSDKTGAGETEWLIPELATRALDVAQLYAAPLQKLWKEQLDAMLEKAPDSTYAIQEQAKLRSLFICKGQFDSISVMTDRTMVDRLNAFSERYGITHLGEPFRITNHMFRRTFANYVSQSSFGSVRYLREHFKHWSLDMTWLYARNEKAQMELIDEINMEVRGHKVTVITDLLGEKTLISGGAKECSFAFRNSDESMRIYESRKAMAELLSPAVTIRPTGSAWCTSDTGGCGGRGVVERTRCGDCDGSIIEARHIPFWAGRYQQMLELRQVDDIGPSGKERVERDIQRCEKVLGDLGILEQCQAEASKEMASV